MEASRKTTGTAEEFPDLVLLGAVCLKRCGSRHVYVLREEKSACQELKRVAGARDNAFVRGLSPPADT